MTASRPTPARRGQHGYVLLTLVLLGALVAAATLSFARHAILAADGAATSVAHERGENAVGSGMAFVAQSLRADGSGTLSQTFDSGQLDVTVTDLSATQRQISVTAADPAGGSHVLDAVAEIYPVTEGVLPELTSAANTIARTAPGLQTLASNTSFTETEVTGVLMLRRGVKLELDNVVLTGLIISENAVRGHTGDPNDDVRIEIKGGLLVQSGSVLPGLAIMAPDAIIDGSDSDAKLQVHGAIVARGLTMAGPAAIHGQLATEQPPIFLGTTDFPGAGRQPRAWPDSLAFVTSAVGRVLFRSTEPSAGEKTAIQNFAWPAIGSAGTFSSAQPAAPAPAPPPPAPSGDDDDEVDDD